MDGSPVWLMLVGPPSSGKSDLLFLISAIQNVFMTATMTEAALLSGSGKKERNHKSTGGLLRQIGEHGMIVAKDFTSVLSMGRDPRAAVLAALREIYDGKWVRHLGNDGGQEILWEGQVGFLGAVTDIIDSHHSVISMLGDRFIYCRMDNADQDHIGDMVLDRNKEHFLIRAGLRELTTEFFEQVFDNEHAPLMYRPLSGYEQKWLKSLSMIAAIGRSAVVRNYRNEIDDVLEPESIARLLGAMSHLYRVLECIGCCRKEAQRLIEKVAMDCMPRKRVRLIQLLIESPELPVKAMCEDRLTDYPPTTVHRVLTDMECLRIVARRGEGVKGDSELWSLHPEFRKELLRGLPYSFL